MDLTLARTGTDRAPADEVRVELGHDRIEELASGRKAQVRHVEQKAARLAQPGADREAAIELRIVDQSLPADGRPRLLEVDPHHDREFAAVFLAERGETLGVLEARLGIVNRAGTDDHDETVVLAVDDPLDLPPTGEDGLGLAGPRSQNRSTRPVGPTSDTPPPR